MQIKLKNFKLNEAAIIDTILSKYSRKGKHTKAGAKDVRLLCETINSLIQLNNRVSLNVADNEISASIINNTTRIMLILEDKFLHENKQSK